MITSRAAPACRQVVLRSYQDSYSGTTRFAARSRILECVILGLIVAAEIGFWVILAAGLAVRYLLRKPGPSTVILSCVHVVNLGLVVATAYDLRSGAPADVAHGLAALYLGFTLAYGHSVVRWADARFAYRFAGGPPPPKPSRYGRARTIREWRASGQAILGAGLSSLALFGMIFWVGDPERSASLWPWIYRMGLIVGIALLWALSYTIWPKREPVTRR